MRLILADRRARVGPERAVRYAGGEAEVVERGLDAAVFFALVGIDCGCPLPDDRAFAYHSSRPPLILVGDGGADGNADTEHRQLFAIDQAPDPRFPPSAHVGHLWLLAPDRPRPEATRCQPETPAAALAGLIRAAMPLLLSAAFPVERKALMATANTLLQQVVPAAVGTGHDLVRAPARDWERLLEILAF